MKLPNTATSVASENWTFHYEHLFCDIMTTGNNWDCQGVYNMDKIDRIIFLQIFLSLNHLPFEPLEF